MPKPKNNIAYAQYILRISKHLYLLQSNRKRNKCLHSRQVISQKV